MNLDTQLAQLESADLAHAARTQAREVIEFIAAHVPEEMCTSFLALPDAHAVRKSE